MLKKKKGTVWHEIAVSVLTLRKLFFNERGMVLTFEFNFFQGNARENANLLHI